MSTVAVGMDFSQLINIPDTFSVPITNEVTSSFQRQKPGCFLAIQRFKTYPKGHTELASKFGHICEKWPFQSPNLNPIEYL